MEVVVSFQLDYGQSSAVRDGEQIEHAAISCGEGRDLRIQDVGPDGRFDVHKVAAQLGLEPPLRLKAEERIAQRAAAVAVLKEPSREFPEEVFGLRREWRFIRARAKGDLVLAREGTGHKSMPDACEFKAMQDECDLCGATRANFRRRAKTGAQQPQHIIDR